MRNPKALTILEACPYLAVAFNMKRRLLQFLLDVFQQFRVGDQAPGASLDEPWPISLLTGSLGIVLTREVDILRKEERGYPVTWQIRSIP
jgi:hypothetical protein